MFRIFSQNSKVQKEHFLSKRTIQKQQKETCFTSFLYFRDSLKPLVCVIFNLRVTAEVSPKTGAVRQTLKVETALDGSA